MAKTKKGWVRCPICRTKMRADKLDSHKKRVHPKGARTREERDHIEGRRRMAEGTAKWLVVAVVIVVIILVSYYVWTTWETRGTKVGEKPPNFVLKDQDGFTYELDNHLGEKPILIAFMGSKCGHCAEEAPLFQEIFLNHSDELDIIIIISNQDATPTEIKEWSIEHGLEFPVLDDSSGDVFLEYDLKYFPSIFLVDKEGKIHWKEIGAMTLDGLEEKVKEVL